MSKASLRRVIALACSFAVFFASAAAQGSYTLKVQEPYGLDMTNSSANAFDRLLREYEAAHPGIKIEYLSPPDRSTTTRRTIPGCRRACWPRTLRTS